MRNGQQKEVAEQIRRAALLTSLVEQASLEDVNSATTRAHRELEAIAHGCESGAITTREALDKRLAEVHYSVAQLMHENAKASWSRQQTRKTGYYLRSAARHLVSGTKFIGEVMAKGLIDFLYAALQAGAVVEERAGASKRSARASRRRRRGEVARAQMQPRTGAKPEPAAAGTQADRHATQAGS